MMPLYESLKNRAEYLSDGLRRLYSELPSFVPERSIFYIIYEVMCVYVLETEPDRSPIGSDASPCPPLQSKSDMDIFFDALKTSLVLEQLKDKLPPDLKAELNKRDLSIQIQEMQKEADEVLKKGGANE